MPALPLEEELHRLLERFESQPEGRLFAPLADCYRRLGRLDESYKVCVDGLARHPRYSTGFVILGKIHLDRDESEDARTAFETVLSIDPENLVALRQLAIDAERRGDREGSRARWEQIVVLDPDSEDAEEHLRSLGAEAAPESNEEISDELPPAEMDEASEAEANADEIALAAGAAEEPPDEDATVLEKKTEVEPAAPEVLMAMSREDSLHPAGASAFTEEGDEAETIITVTLADIYYEQGFKAKALEMYRTVMLRHPAAAEVAGLGEKVEQIEEEMESLAKRFQQSTGEAPEGNLDELEASPKPELEDSLEEEAEDGVRKFRAWVQKRRRPGA